VRFPHRFNLSISEDFQDILTPVRHPLTQNKRAFGSAQPHDLPVATCSGKWVSIDSRTFWKLLPNEGPFAIQGTFCNTRDLLQYNESAVPPVR
jgi:hypothetical protein